ncbi:hypothetical protein [Roseomonas rosulenta]|uniref:hypothetical protein n=1 Tax=Roseomonas rosulenta TaxID=2748667 RepID=UPI0018DF2D0A|nr:hypothetical protein [Roseomonas rosulenta]
MRSSKHERWLTASRWPYCGRRRGRVPTEQPARFDLVLRRPAAGLPGLDLVPFPLGRATDVIG